MFGVQERLPGQLQRGGKSEPTRKRRIEGKRGKGGKRVVGRQAAFPEEKWSSAGKRRKASTALGEEGSRREGQERGDTYHYPFILNVLSPQAFRRKKRTEPHPAGTEVREALPALPSISGGKVKRKEVHEREKKAGFSSPASSWGTEGKGKKTTSRFFKKEKGEREREKRERAA